MEISKITVWKIPKPVVVAYYSKLIVYFFPAPRGILDAGNLSVIPLSSDSYTLQEDVVEVLPLFSGKNSVQEM